MRINKYIATCGVCARRKADELILNGAVTVNGQAVTEFIDIDPERDIVRVNGKEIREERKKYYIALNKPKGYITSTDDDRGRHSVTELVADIDARLFPVGRLDFNTTGLLLLTNDGDFANRVTHPSGVVNKTYIARVKGIPDPIELEILRKGIRLEDGKTAPAEVSIIKTYPSSCDIKISIHEGKNRQVRRMFEALGYETIELSRVSIGRILLGNLPYGKWRHLTDAEIKILK